VGDGERAAQVDGEHEVPQSGVGLDEEGEEVGAGVVDEHVDRPERSLDRGDGGIDGVCVGDVHQAGVPVELGGDGASTLFVQVANRNARALGCKAPSGCGPNPRCPAGDERDLALQTHVPQRIRPGADVASARTYTRPPWPKPPCA
jgi:hypothetical protein